MSGKAGGKTAKRKMGPKRNKVTKRPRFVKPIAAAVFDEEARAEFLTGFSKRKQERKSASRARAEAKAKAEHMELRKSMREDRKARAAANVAADRNALGLEEDGEDEEEGDDVDREQQFETEDFHTTVTIEEFDPHPQPAAPEPIALKPGHRKSKAGNQPASRRRQPDLEAPSLPARKSVNGKRKRRALALLQATHMQLDIGARVASKDRIGTVRYVGPVEGTSGSWFGVDWDEGVGGRHDGSRAGRRYFNTLEGPSAGSFVRASELSTGVSMHAALVSRNTSSPSASTFDTDFGRPIEAIGLDAVTSRVSQLAKLRTVSLSGEGVSGAGDEADEQRLRTDGVSIASLDLSRSLMPDFESLARIVDCLPSLRSLDISRNRFARLAQPFASVAFRNIRELSLNKTRTIWTEMLLLAPALPQLEILRLAGNGIDTISSPDSAVFTRLTELNLESNELSSWSQIRQSLAPLPSLATLIVSRNRLTTLEPSGQEALGSLRQLSLAHNELSSVECFSSLQQDCPTLTRLSIAGNSFSQDERTLRLEAIARIATVTTLDGSQVTAAERRDAELLRSRVGSVADEPTAALTRPSGTLELTVHGDERVTIHALPGTTVRALKARISKLTTLPARFALALALSNGSLLALDDRHTLDRAGVADGDSLRVVQ